MDTMSPSLVFNESMLLQRKELKCECLGCSNAIGQHMGKQMLVGCLHLGAMMISDAWNWTDAVPRCETY